MLKILLLYDDMNHAAMMPCRKVMRHIDLIKNTCLFPFNDVTAMFFWYSQVVSANSQLVSTVP